MCGLVGMLSLNHISLVQSIRDLTLMSSMRGSDATGMFTVSQKMTDVTTRKASWLKSSKNPLDFIRSRPFRNHLLSDDNIKLVGVHTRYATIGEKVSSNAHPFEYGNIIGMHNGTIRSGLDVEKGATDSEALIKKLSESDIKTVLSSIFGAFALVWYDTAALTLNFIRNDERPLYYAHDTGKINFVWASEKPMIELLAERSYFTPKLTIHELPKDTLLSMDTTTFFNAIDKIRLEEVKTTRPFVHTCELYEPWDQSLNGWEGAGVRATLDVDGLPWDHPTRTTKPSGYRQLPHRPPSGSSETSSRESVEQSRLPAPSSSTSPAKTLSNGTSAAVKDTKIGWRGSKNWLNALETVQDKKKVLQLLEQPATKSEWDAEEHTMMFEYGYRSNRYFATSKEFMDILGHGCVFCDRQYSLGQGREFAKFYSRREFVCAPCLINEPEVQAQIEQLL